MKSITSNQNTKSIVEEINTLSEQKVTIYQINDMAFLCRYEVKIINAEESSYAQYPDGIKIIVRGKRKRNNSIIRAYRGCSWEDKTGTQRPRLPVSILILPIIGYR